ncbi:MAG TPA: hypothetical protein VNN20_00215 [Thermodesulfobacteriota bacterium]|nr:hypothetical protein [Thermodesulfobacteriota bacterium]
MCYIAETFIAEYINKMEEIERITLTLLYCFIFVLAIDVVQSKSRECPEGTMKVPNSNICIEKVNPTRAANFKDVSMYCLSRNLDICLAEQIVKACQEGLIKVPSVQSPMVFLTSSGMFVSMMPDCNISKTGPIGSSEKEQFLCCAKLSK